jgi:redox-sensitive bicupin YhaK (pirin superfamily)
MSDLLVEPKISDSKDCPDSARKPVHETIATHDAKIGDGLIIHRALPTKARRMIGAWCFFDHFGPLNLTGTQGLNVAPHPHIGLQTFTWTLSGEILHRDSLGSKQVITPGKINLMTAGKGICHSEESLPTGILHGVQLWIALPDEVRNMEPEFAHYEELPTLQQDNILLTLLVGDYAGQRAPTKVYSPMLGLDLQTDVAATTTLSLDPAFEYGVMVLAESATIEKENLAPGTLLYLGCGRTELTVTLAKNARVFLIGGEPFGEEILVWWNFVGRTRDEIVDATNDWEHHRRFGEVHGYVGDRLTAPSVPWIK